MSFQIKIVTPSSLAYEGEAVEVVIPGFEGQYGVLPSHAQILTLSKPGILSIFPENGDVKRYVIDKGFVEFSNNSLTALVDIFEPVDAVNKESASSRLQELDAELEKLSSTDPKYIQLSNERNLAQVRMDA